MKLIIILVAVLIITVSCGEKCAESTGKTIYQDLSKMRLSGEFKGTYGDMNINFPNDSTAVLTYKENGNTYELTYQIDTIGESYEVQETKPIN
jgi:hypothetical protein